MKELEVLPRDEIVRAYVELSHRYAAEVERATEYQTRIQTLQVQWFLIVAQQL